MKSYLAIVAVLGSNLLVSGAPIAKADPAAEEIVQPKTKFPSKFEPLPKGTALPKSIFSRPKSANLPKREANTEDVKQPEDKLLFDFVPSPHGSALPKAISSKPKSEGLPKRSAEPLRKFTFDPWKLRRK